MISGNIKFDNDNISAILKIWGWNLLIFCVFIEIFIDIFVWDVLIWNDLCII